MNKLILKGKAASGGKVVGRVVVINNLDQKIIIRKNSILVTDMTSPAWLPLIVKAKAVITNKGGLLSHAAIVCRELGKPSIVGTLTATIVLKNNMKVLVDGSKGFIYEIKR